MMKHIRQLAEFKTGMEVRIGYPNEYLSNETSEDLASPMYATGIGLVIEGIAKYETDKLRGKLVDVKNKKEKESVIEESEIIQVIEETKIEEPEIEETQTDETESVNKKRAKNRLTNIVTTFTKFFKPDIDKDITE